jgi:predicted outer membrane lipoprotein
MKETPIFEEVFSRMLGLPGFWVKVLIGGLLSFVPVVNIFAFGYLLRLSSRVRKTGQLVLPEWSDWSGLFKDGLRFAVVWLFYWLLPVLLAAAFASIIGFFGLGALAYLIFSVVFLLAPILFSSALYRYQMRSNLKDLIDVALIIRMTAGSLDRLIIPALVFAGIFAVAAPLYGFAVFFGFGALVIYTSLSFRIIEQRQTVAF